MTDKPQPTIADQAIAILERNFDFHRYSRSSKLFMSCRRQLKDLGKRPADIDGMAKVFTPLAEAQRARVFAEWCEADGDVLWFRLPVCEAPYCGSPLDCGITIETNGPRGLIARGNVGGWPFAEADEAALRWTPIPELFVADQQSLKDKILNWKEKRSQYETQ